MIISVGEVRQIKAIIEEVRPNWQNRELNTHPAQGIMIETSAL
ncbi:MAG: hypothetical protein ACLUI7_10625 [Coprococcus sp.]